MTEQLSDSTPFLSAGASRVVLAGVVAALALGVGLGLWARPGPEALAAAPEVGAASLLEPTPAALQIVVDDPPAPIGAPLDVLPPPSEAVPAAPPTPTPPPPAPPAVIRVADRPAPPAPKPAPVKAKPKPVKKISAPREAKAEAKPAAKAIKAAHRERTPRAASALKAKHPAVKVAVHKTTPRHAAPERRPPPKLAPVRIARADRHPAPPRKAPQASARAARDARWIAEDIYVARVSAQGDDPRGLHRN